MNFLRDRVVVFSFVVALALALQAAAFFKTPPASEVKPFSQNVDRGLARVVWFGGSGVAGEIWMDYGRPAWSDKLEGEMDKPENKRWRFGSDAVVRIAGLDRRAQEDARLIAFSGPGTAWIDAAPAADINREATGELSLLLDVRPDSPVTGEVRIGMNDASVPVTGLL